MTAQPQYFDEETVRILIEVALHAGALNIISQQDESTETSPHTVFENALTFMASGKGVEHVKGGRELVDLIYGLGVNR